MAQLGENLSRGPLFSSNLPPSGLNISGFDTSSNQSRWSVSCRRGCIRRSMGGMLSNRSMLRSTVLPELAYPDIGEAIRRLCEAFGFTLRIRMGDHRAQLNVGDGAVILIEMDREVSTKVGVMVRVEDVNAHYEQARRNGVRILREPADYPYGERQYNAEDFAGHHWSFSQSIADVDPCEWGGTPGRL